MWCLIILGLFAIACACANINKLDQFAGRLASARRQSNVGGGASMREKSSSLREAVRRRASRIQSVTAFRNLLPQRFWDVYEVGDKLGEGAFGVVHEAFERRTGAVYAVKMVDLNMSDPAWVQTEVEQINRVQHDSLT